MPLKVQPRAEKAKTGQKGVEMIVWDIKKKGEVLRESIT